MEQSKSNVGVMALAIIITAVVVGGGVYLWQKNQTTQPKEQAKTPITTPTNVEPTEPLSYSINGASVSVAKKTAPFDYTAKDLKDMAEECGSQHGASYFDQLVSKFNGTTKTMYDFTYTGESQQSAVFTITLLPNKAGYTSLDQFKKDFSICAAGGDAYPAKVNNNWLLFENSCGSGFDDGSGLPVGCDKAREVVEPTLKLN